MTISPAEIDAVTLAAQALPPAKGNYLEPDFVINMLATVIDYQAHTTTVERALDHFKRERWDEIRTFDDLRTLRRTLPERQGRQHRTGPVPLGFTTCGPWPTRMRLPWPRSCGRSRHLAKPHGRSMVEGVISRRLSALHVASRHGPS
jgi:hypothetical protein